MKLTTEDKKFLKQIKANRKETFYHILSNGNALIDAVNHREAISYNGKIQSEFDALSLEEVLTQFDMKGLEKITQNSDTPHNPNRKNTAMEYEAHDPGRFGYLLKDQIEQKLTLAEKNKVAAFDPHSKLMFKTSVLNKMKPSEILLYDALIFSTLAGNYEMESTYKMDHPKLEDEQYMEAFRKQLNDLTSSFFKKEIVRHLNLRQDLQKACSQYKNDLIKKIQALKENIQKAFDSNDSKGLSLYQSSLEKAENKYTIVNQLEVGLNKKNFSTGLKDFVDEFYKNESILRRRIGDQQSFAYKIKTILATMPFIGRLFKTAGDKTCNFFQEKTRSLRNSSNERERITDEKNSESIQAVRG